MFLPKAIATLLIVAGVLAAAPSACARDYALWGGLASFKLPSGAKVTKESSKEYLIAPGPRGRNPVFAVVTRHQLSKVEQAASLRRLALMRKRNFEAEGARVTNLRVDTRQQRVSMDITDVISKSDAVPLAFAGSRTTIRARFVGFRRGANVISAIALSEQKTWNQQRTKSYRRVVDALRVRR